ncbi:MAG: hypothetical protein AAGD33_03655 [Actinomycetota bacterium]
MPRSATTSIPRPQRPAADEGRSRLGDFTRPIPVEKRLVRRPWVVAAAIIGTLAVIATIGAQVFARPVTVWNEQGPTLDSKRAQLTELERVNAELESEIGRLRTDDGIREAAREDYGFVEVGEERSSVLPFPDLPTALPDGYPYNVVTQIITAVERGPAVIPDN